MKPKKILTLVISALMVLTMIPSFSFGAELPFTDVPGSEWYYSDVKGAYETGLINGFEDNTFRPDENMTYAQAIKLAACMSQKYTTGSVTLANGSPQWYDSYVAYAKDQSIISQNYEWNAPATRAGYVEIFANALPDAALQVKNSIADGYIPDVGISHPQAAAIYKLYRAGILTGMDEKGTFSPDSNIRRSEVSAILTRMMNKSARKELTLGPVSEMPETPKEDDNPFIVKTQPKDCAVGDTLFVEVSGGKEPYTYQWAKDDSAISGATDSSYPAMEAGQYYCTITDSAGIQGKTNTVRVSAPPSTPLSITKQPQNCTVGETLSVEVTGGKEPYIYRWINKQSGKVYGQSRTYTTEAAGEFFCRITDNASTYVISNTVSVTGSSSTSSPVPLSITKQPTGANLKRYESTTLTIETSGGDGTVTYTWQKYNAASSSWSTVGTGKSLTVEGTQCGKYRCVVKDSSSASLTSTAVDVEQSLRVDKVTHQEGNYWYFCHVTGGTKPYSLVGVWRKSPSVTYWDDWSDYPLSSKTEDSTGVLFGFYTEVANAQFVVKIKDADGAEVMAYINCPAGTVPSPVYGE